MRCMQYIFSISDSVVTGFCSGEGGADEDRKHVQHCLQGQTHTGSDAAGRRVRHGALHHRTAGGGETSSGGDGGRQRHDGRRPRPEISTGGGESPIMMQMGGGANLKVCPLHQTFD